MFETSAVCSFEIHVVLRSVQPYPDSIAVLATQAIANVVKSSFGPSGLDKMMVDDIGVRSFRTPRCLEQSLMVFRM
jgi:hypothetical protein